MATFDRVIPLLVYQDIEAAHDFLAELGNLSAQTMYGIRP